MWQRMLNIVQLLFVQLFLKCCPRVFFLQQTIKSLKWCPRIPTNSCSLMIKQRFHQHIDQLGKNFSRIAFIFTVFCFWSSMDSIDQHNADDNLPISSIFFAISGSTYRHRQTSSVSYVTNDRFRICLPAPILEHLHEVNFAFTLWPLTSLNCSQDIEADRRPSCEIRR